MTQPALPLDGGCRCGRVRFRLNAAPMLTMVCHCKGCQRMTGSAYSLSALAASEAFEVTAGEPVLGGMKASPKHHHCPDCMSWVFTRMDDAPHLVNVRATLFDDTDWFRPYMATCAAEKLAWVEVPVARSFDGFPGMEDYPALLQGYATAQKAP